MTHRFFRIALSLALATSCLNVAFAEGWKLPNLNPFKSSEPAIDEEPAPAAPAKPSAWTRFNRGTKNVLTRTGEVLNPFDGKPAKKSPPKSAGLTRKSYSGVRTSKVAEEKPGFFSSMTSWMKPKEEPKKTATVTDFLDLPRPY